MRAAPPPPTPTPSKPLSDLPETSDISDTSFDSESTELQIFLNKEDDVTRVESQASTSKSTSQNIDDYRPVINKKLMGALQRYREREKRRAIIDQPPIIYKKSEKSPAKKTKKSADPKMDKIPESDN